MAVAGVVGAGLMGTAMTRRLFGAGFQVLAYDVDAGKRTAIAQAGARAVDTLEPLVQEASCIVLAVFNTDQVEAVVDGPGGIRELQQRCGTQPIILCTSTCDPDRISVLAQRVAPQGVRFLEVPVSGTSRQVADGDGVGLIGGEKADMDDAAGVLDAITPRRYHLGAPGNGSRAKLAVNLILGLNRAAMAEGLVFAERLGLDREAFLNVAKGSACYSQVMDVKGLIMARRDYLKPQSRIDQSLKDFKLMLEQAHEVGQELPFATVYKNMLEDCLAHGEAEWDNGAIAEAILRARPA